MRISSLSLKIIYYLNNSKKYTMLTNQGCTGCKVTGLKTELSRTMADLNPDIDSIISRSNSMEQHKEITQPYDYLLQIPGNNQNMRYKFLVAFNEKFFHISHEEILHEIGDIISIFHNASLLIDDIEDDSTLRRGLVCAHIKYGVPSTINCGNYMYFVALNKAMTLLPQLWLLLPNSETQKVPVVKEQTMKILVDEMLNLHNGQGLDIYWRDNLQEVMNQKLPSMSEYLQMIMNKTGGLFRLSVKLLGLFADETELWDLESLTKLANLIGIIYQVRDDYLNLADTRYSEMKGCVGEDLIEGKLSLPVHHSLSTIETENNPLRYILFQLDTAEKRRKDLDSIKAAVQFLKDGSSLIFTYEVLQTYVRKAKSLILLYSDPSDMLLKVVDGLGDVVKPT